MFKWGKQQEAALKAVKEWMDDPHAPQVFYLAGFAGVGKSTLVRFMINESNRRWLFGAYTGKAAYVLRMKGCEGAGTVHSIIYRPAGETLAHEIELLQCKIATFKAELGKRFPKKLNDTEDRHMTTMVKSLNKLMNDQQPRFALWANSPLAEFDVEGIAVDEVSMIDTAMGKDLESFGKKILVLGDPAQLPPVGAAGYFTKRKPNFVLTEIHRQEEGSDILRLATIVRNGNGISGFQSTSSCEIIQASNKEAVRERTLMADQVLVGLNVTRRQVNQRYRAVTGMVDKGPMPDDRLVCLRNEHNVGLFNGSQWVVEDVHNDYNSMFTDLTIRSEDDESTRVETCGWLHHFMQEKFGGGIDRCDLSEFDWSYALTVHKAQGSQWDNVVLFDQSRSFRHDAWRWLYTGITRASKKLTLVV